MKLFKILTRENPISILMVTHDPNLAKRRQNVTNERRNCSASDIKSAWGITDEEEKNEYFRSTWLHGFSR